MQFVTQVQALAEFGDLPQNVDLIVLQQLSSSTEQNYIDVRDCPATLWLKSLFLPLPATVSPVLPSAITSLFRLLLLLLLLLPPARRLQKPG